MSSKTYSDSISTSIEMITGQFNKFPEGQFLVEADDKIVGHCATFIVREELAFADRMPNYAKRQKKVKSPENYIELVIENKIKDPVIGFQLKNGFKFLKILKNYMSGDL